MKKAFNKKKVDNVLSELIGTYGINCFEERDIYTKKAYNKIKAYINDPRGVGLKSLYSYMVINKTTQDIEAVIKRFFPTKFETVRQFVEAGGKYQTLAFLYHPIDQKVHWNIVQFHENQSLEEGERREMKLKTDLYLERTEQERKDFLEYINTCFEKIYGYHFDINNSGLWFITDGNKVTGGYKRIVAGHDNDVTYIRKNNKFCDENFTADQLVYA